MAPGGVRRIAGCAPAILLIGALHGTPAFAATYRFAIASKPVVAALIDFALQTNISVGGEARCTGLAGALEGSFALEAGLAKLLAPTSCTFKAVSPDAILILARPPNRAAAPAAKAPPTDKAMASEVIVTATKRRALADQLPYAVSLVGAQTLRESGAVDATDIAAGISGVSTTNLGPGRDKVLLRGLSDGSFTGRTQSTVGLFLNDTPLTYNAPDPDLRLTDVQAVEVLRGPQGSLYGGGSMSGVYRIRTREPELNRFSGDLMAGGGYTQQGAASDEAEAVLNLPLLRDVAALRLVAYREEDGGYIENVLLRSKNIDTTRRVGGRAALRALLSADWTLTLGAATQSIHDDDTQYVSPALGRLHRANAIAESSGNRFGEAYVTLERNTSGSNFRSTTSFLQREITTRTDASTALPIFGAAAPGVGAFDEPITLNTLVEDMVLSSPNLGRWRWLIGAFASVTHEDTVSTVKSGDNAIGVTHVLYDERRKDRFNELAGYGETAYALTDRLTLTAGFRASQTTTSAISLVTAPLTGRRRAFSGSRRFTGLSPKLALDFQFSPTSLVYALVSEGRRAGGFNTGAPLGVVFSYTPKHGQVNRGFAPDELWNYETGLKLKLLDRRLAVRAALFYDDWRQIQTDQYLASGLSYTTNAGDGHNYGFETDIEWRPTNHLTFGANALVDHPQLTHPNAGFVAVKNAGLPDVPDLTLSARAAYSWALTPNLSAFFSAQTQYVGHSYVAFAPTAAPIMGGYVLDRLAAQLSAPGWRLAAYVINPTGEGGNTFSYGNPFNFQQVAQTTPQRPRTVRMTLSVDF